MARRTATGPRAAVAVLVLVFVSACSPVSRPDSSGRSVPLPPPTSSSSAPAFPIPTAGIPHVMIIVLENRSYADALDPSRSPYVASLAGHHGLALASFGQTHPSLPNYLELLAGSTFGVHTDCTTCSVEGTTLVDQFDARSISWKAYMEGLPHPCFTGATARGGYARKHDPFVYVRHIVSDPRLCDRVVPFTDLAGDLRSNAMPAFAWVTPNLCDDGHDCPASAAGAWLKRQLPAVLASAWYRDGGVVIVTFDEGRNDAGCCTLAAGGHIATIVLTAAAPPGVRSNLAVDHAGILATVEDLYHLRHLGDAACPCSGSLLPLL